MKPLKFRKKPVTIEAMLFDGSKEAADAIMDWTGKDGGLLNTTPHSLGLHIKTLEGTMKVAPGDWVIKGVNGEFYPCKPDIFQKTYVQVVGRGN